LAKQEPESTSDSKSKPRKYLARYSDDKILAESVIISGKPKYAVVNDTEIKFEDNINEYYPPKGGLGRGHSFKTEKEFNETLEAAKHETLDTLYAEVLMQWRKYSRASEFENELCAFDTIYTYYQDIFGMTHYVFFVGSPDSGKSNKLGLLNVLGYRNFMSSDMTAANIYRHLGCEQENQGTICEDEADDLDDSRDKMRIYKNGYVSGVRIPRNDKENFGSLNQNGYYTYGFKAFAAERSPDSTKAKGFKSRTVEINCIADIPDSDLSEVLNPASADEFVSQRNQLFELRNLLFCYKLLHCHDKIPNINLNISNREKQLFKPLIRLFQGTKTQSTLLNVISHFVNERRNANADTLVSMLYTIVCDQVAQFGTIIESHKIWEAVKESTKGSDIPYKPRSCETAEFGTISEKGIIEAIKDNFKAKPPKHHSDKRQLEFNLDFLARLEPKYSFKTIEVKEEGETFEAYESYEAYVGRTSEPGDKGTNTLVNEPNSPPSFAKDMTHTPHMPQNGEVERVLDRLKLRHIEKDMSQTSGDMPQTQSHTQTQSDEDGGHSQRVNGRYENIDK
jgi:hypothetical protein